MKIKQYIIFITAVITAAVLMGCGFADAPAYNAAEPKKHIDATNITGLAPRTEPELDITESELITEPPETEPPPVTTTQEPPATVPETTTQAPTTTEPPTTTTAPPTTQPPTTPVPPTQPPTTTQPPPPPTTAAPVIDLNEYAAEVLRLTNAERANKNLAALANNISLLDNAALLRADEIIISFSHTRPDGRSFDTAYEDLGGVYMGAWTGWGENLAWSSGNYSTPENIVDGWMNSPGHRDNILNSKWTHIGVGVAMGNDGALYWVQLFFG